MLYTRSWIQLVQVEGHSATLAGTVLTPCCAVQDVDLVIEGTGVFINRCERSQGLGSSLVHMSDVALKRSGLTPCCPSASLLCSCCACYRLSKTCEGSRYVSGPWGEYSLALFQPVSTVPAQVGASQARGCQDKTQVQDRPCGL